MGIYLFHPTNGNMANMVQYVQIHPDVTMYNVLPNFSSEIRNR